MFLLKSSAFFNCGLVFTDAYKHSFRSPVLSAHSALMGKKCRSSRVDPYSEADYLCHDGVRSVIPYIHEFTTHAKGRWIGREITEVLTREFGGHPKEYWTNAISRGYVRINDRIVEYGYRFKNNDAMLHRTHRHEPSIAGVIEFVGDTESLMAVSKPPSIPVHPCGAYRFNSLMYILAKEPMIENQPDLFLVHRLDRVTSGLVVLAKSKEAASNLSTEIRDKSTKKTYLARVKGKFPIQLEKFRVLSIEDILRVVMDDDDDDEDDDKKNGNGNGSGNGNKQQQQQQQKSKKRDRNGNPRGVEINESDLPPRVRDIPTFEEVVRSDKVGCSVDAATGDFTLRCPIGVISHRDGVHACDPEEGKEAVTAFSMLGYDEVTDTSLVECRPVTGRTHQLRLHLQIMGNSIANDPCYGGELFYGDSDRRQRALEVLRNMRREGKHPLSKVPHLGDPELDNYIPNTSAVSGEAPTMGSDESTGVCVEAKAEGVGGIGVDLVVDADRHTVIEAGAGSDKGQDGVAADQTACSSVPLVPTLAPTPVVDDKLSVSPIAGAANKEIVESKTVVDVAAGLTETNRISAASTSITPGVEVETCAKVEVEVEVEVQGGTETDKEYLVRTCRYCREEKESQELERLLHCDGIWLHALRYEGKGWLFQAPTPAWALNKSFSEIAVKKMAEKAAP